MACVEVYPGLEVCMRMSGEAIAYAGWRCELRSLCDTANRDGFLDWMKGDDVVCRSLPRSWSALVKLQLGQAVDAGFLGR